MMLSCNVGRRCTKVTLAVLTAVACALAIGAAFTVYQLHKAKAVEPAILAHGWYYDEGVSAFMGGPGRQGFEAVAVLDAKGVDGAVNGTASAVRRLGTVLRRLQSGYVRSYAVGIGLGAVAMMAWFVVRGLS